MREYEELRSEPEDMKDFFLISSVSVLAIVCLLPIWLTFVGPPGRVRCILEVSEALEDASSRLRIVRSSSWYVLKLSPRVLNLYESGHWTGQLALRGASFLLRLCNSLSSMFTVPSSRETPDQGRLVYQHSFSQASSLRLLLFQCSSEDIVELSQRVLNFDESALWTRQRALG